MTQPDNLTRFLDAQSGDFATALAEIKTGHKQSHWMWYIFPQLAGLGVSDRSAYYGIKDLAEAKAYLAHPVLGARLREISSALLKLPTTNPTEVFGIPDDLKLRSCMTLFSLANPEDRVFADVLRKYFGGMDDERTRDLLGL